MRMKANSMNISSKLLVSSMGMKANSKNISSKLLVLYPVPGWANFPSSPMEKSTLLSSTNYHKTSPASKVNFSEPINK